MATATSLDTPIQADDSSELIDLLQDENQELPDSRLIEMSVQEGVNRILDTLNDRERECSSFTLVWVRTHPHTHDEIGRRLHLTRERYAR